MHPRTHLVIRLRARRDEVGAHRLRIRFLDPEGHELLAGDGEVRFGEPPAGVTDLEAATVFVFDVPLPRPGAYRFVLDVDGRPAVEVPLTASTGDEGPTLN